MSIEERTFLNDIGHIMDWLWAELLVYEHRDDEERRRELRREVHGVRHQIEDRKNKGDDSRGVRIGVPGLLEKEDVL